MRPISHPVPLLHILFMALLMNVPHVSAQNGRHTVTGTVRDQTGAPLVGATVMVEGTQNGTIADVDGSYSLSVTDGDVLQALYIGYLTASQKAGTHDIINFILKEDKQTLDEVVVIGYDTARKSDLTGAVASVKMSDLATSPATSVDNALQGRVAGAEIMTTTGEPGAVTSIRIRGTRSITASNEPLIVVDGIIDAIRDLNDINPDDIESISILKDASSTAIYGAQGANGVILITTRQTKGVTKKPNVTLSAKVGISQLPRKLDIMNASEFARYRNDVITNGADSNWSSGSTTLPLSSLRYSDPLSVTGTDWLDEVTRTAVYQNYNLSVSGSERGSSYYCNLGWNDIQGIIDKSGEKKFTGRIKVEKRLYKWLKVGYNGFYTWRDNEPAKASIGGTSVHNSAQYLAPTISPRDSFNPFYDNGVRFNNPRALINNITWHRYYNTMTHTFTLDVEPAKNLKLTSRLAYSNWQYHNFLYRGGSLPAKAANDGGEATRGESDQKTLSSETTLRYVWNINKKHHLTPMVGFSAYRKVSNELSLSGNGYTDDSILWNDMAAVLDKETYSANTGYYKINKASVFGRLNYSYDKRWYLTVTGRYDGASNFAVNNKWAFFPSAALRWSISNEKWMKGASWINDLSLRLSAGRTGNDAISAYRSLATMNTSSNGYIFDASQPMAIYRNRVASPDLTWEKTDQYNIGLDLSMLKQRINITAEAYYSKTSDLLLNVQLPSQTGYSSRLENIGVTSNKGIELTIETVNINRYDLQWTTALTISHNNQMVDDIGTDDFVSAYNSPGASKYMMYGYVKGYPLYALWGFKYGGTWKSDEEVERNKVTRQYISTISQPGYARYLDINHDGSLNQLDLVYLGSADPWLQGGLQNTVYWRGFKLGVYFVYSLGGKIYNVSELYMAGSITTNQYRYMLGAWHPVRNPDSDIPAAGSRPNATIPSDFMVHDASYLRLKDVSLSYTFDFQRHRNFPVRELTLGISSDNLWLWKKYNGFDPDVNSTGTTTVMRRADIGAYPKARTILLNANIKF